MKRHMTMQEQRAHCREQAKGFDVWDLDTWERKAERIARTYGWSCFSPHDDQSESESNDAEDQNEN
jgi:hypothetical protein